VAAADDRQAVVGHDTGGTPAQLLAAVAGNPLGQGREQTPLAVMIDLTPAVPWSALDVDTQPAPNWWAAPPVPASATAGANIVAAQTVAAQTVAAQTGAAETVAAQTVAAPGAAGPGLPAEAQAEPSPWATDASTWTLDIPAAPVDPAEDTEVIEDAEAEPAELGFGGFRWEYDHQPVVRPPWRRRDRGRINH